MKKNILKKTLGGLSLSYYLRNLFFGAIFGGFIIFFILQSNTKDYFKIIYTIICIFLYPYSKFIYDTIIEFIMGNNIFIVNIIFMFAIKSMVIISCLLFAPIIALIGFIYLYFYHTKNKTFD